MSTIIGIIGAYLWPILSAIGVLALGIFGWKSRQSGVDAQKQKQAQADQRAAETISKSKAEAAAKDDAALNREVDRWTRK